MKPILFFAHIITDDTTIVLNSSSRGAPSPNRPVMNLRVRHSANNQAPHSLHEQRFVLSLEQISDLAPALTSTVFSGPNDVEDGIDAEDWGILFTPEGQSVHPAIKKIVHHITDNNLYLKSHVVKGRPSVRRVSVVKMDSSPPTPARNRFQPQHHWHKDGGTSLITVVYTLYNGEWDSENSPGAFELGGRVALADTASGTAVYADSSFTSVRSGRIRTYYPRTNSLYILPGQHVSHAVFRVEVPLTVRYAIVFFLEPRSHFTFYTHRLPVDEYFRICWALGFYDDGATKRPLFCSRCFRLFSNKKQQYDHNRRVSNCKAKEAKQRLLDSSK